MGAMQPGQGGIVESMRARMSRTMAYRKEGLSRAEATEKAASERTSADGGVRSETEEERKKRLAANEKHRQDTLLGGGA
jgi:hypothetical protein